jgi:hypothetical protein
LAPASLLFSIAAWAAALVFLIGRWGRPWPRIRNGRRRDKATRPGPEPPPVGTPVPEPAP